jgi:hypothetical protein
VSEGEAALLGALLGGLIGGALGVVSTLLASYFAPRWLEQGRAKEEEERNWGPRKRLLEKMLAAPNPPIRTFKRCDTSPEHPMRIAAAC